MTSKTGPQGNKPQLFHYAPPMLPDTDLLRVAGVDVEVAELLVVVVLVVQVLQRLSLLVLAKLGSNRWR